MTYFREEVRWMGDQPERDFRLPGEPAISGELDDIEHWLSVYSELIELCEHLVAGAETAADSLLGEWRSRLGTRLAFWEERKRAWPG